MSEDQDHCQRGHQTEDKACCLNMSEDLQEGQHSRPLNIQQQNINKSLISQLDLLASLRRDDYNICAIQEPYIDFNGKTCANRQWVTVYPITHEEHTDAMRSVTLVNTDLLTDTWRQIQLQHPDITAIEMTVEFSMN